jgi:hypothetical protein
MEVSHGGDLWLEKLIPIEVDLNAHIIGIPSWGMDPAQFLEEKTKEKSLVEEMKNKYDTERGTCRIIIKQISDKNGHKHYGLQDALKMPQGGSPTGFVTYAA